MDNKKIGSFIAKNRKEQGLTQEQLGERLGVSNKTVSRWENGNYMPDLSLLEPLSRELKITVNELLAGEAIEEEKAAEYSEKALISTIDYSAGKIRKEHKKISVFLMSAGLLSCLCAFAVIPPESSWSSIFSILGLFLLAFGLFREWKWKSIKKRLLASSLVFVLLLSVFFLADYVGVVTYRRPPIYRHVTETLFTDTKIIVYYNPFYRVYRIHADTPDEYYIVDLKKAYTAATVPITR